MHLPNWLSDNYIEVFGAIAGIVYVFLEIRQTIWLWPVGIITSAVYIWVFFTTKFYADMSLQVYYLGISFLGWYWWRASASLSIKGSGCSPPERTQTKLRQYDNGSVRAGAQGEEQRAQGTEQRRGEGERGRQGDEGTEGLRDEGTEGLVVTRLKLRTGVLLAITFVTLYALMWFVLSEFTDSPVPSWDAFITSLSVVATWMLARKIYEHWFLWIVVNFVSAVIFMIKGLYPTVILYIVYGIMSFAGLVLWKKSMNNENRSINKQES